MNPPARPDVFISYAREDHEAAARVAHWCASLGWSVWWDQNIAPGRKWDDAIESALADARCVLVLWSVRSVVSDWVKNEAAEAVRRGVMVPVLIENVLLPLEFRRIQTLDLAKGWGPSEKPTLDRLSRALAEHIGHAAAPVTLAAAPAIATHNASYWRTTIFTAISVTVGGLAIWQFVPSDPAAPRTSAPAPVQQALVPITGAEALAAMRGPALRPERGLAGADVARLADGQLQALIDKAQKSSRFWTSMLEKEDGAALLEQVTLLAVEATRRQGGAAAVSALRRALVLMARPLRSLPHEDAVLGLAFSTDGRLIGTTSRDWTAAVWDASSGRKILTLKHQDTVYDIAFSQDGRFIATASDDKTARLWRMSDGKELAVLRHPDAVTRVRFVGDGKVLATLSKPEGHVSVRLWSVPEGRETRQIVPREGTHDFVFSDDGRYLFFTPRSGSVQPVQVWDAATGEKVTSLSGESVVSSVATHRDVVAVAEWGHLASVVSFWRLGTWAPLGQVGGMGSGSVVALSEDAARLVVGESNARYGQILMAPVAEGKTRSSVLNTRMNGGICCLAISADGSHAVASSMDDIATVIDLRSGEEVLRARLTETGSLGAALSPDGRLLLTAGGASANVWEIKPGDPLRAACERVGRSFTPEEWRRWFGNEPWRKTCP